MAVVGELTVNLRAHTAAFATDLKKATALSFGSSREIERSLKMIGTASLAAAGAVAGAFLVMAERTGKYAEGVLNASQITGMAVEDIQKLSFAAEQAGVPFEALQIALKKFSQGLSGFSQDKGFDRALKSMGIDPKALKGLDDLHEQLLVVADGFARTADGSVKSAASVELMGKTGNALIPVLNGGRESVLAFERQAESLGIVLGEKDVAAAALLDDQIGMLRVGLAGTERQLAMTVIPTLNEFLTVTIGLAQVGLPSATQAVRDFAAGMVYLSAVTNPFGSAAKVAGWISGWDPFGAALDAATLKIAGGEKQTEDLTKKIIAIRAALAAAAGGAKVPPIVPGEPKKTKEKFDLSGWTQGAADAASARLQALSPAILIQENKDLAIQLQEVEAAVRESFGGTIPENIQTTFHAMQPLTPEFVKMQDAARRWGQDLESAFTGLILHGRGARETLNGILILLGEMVIKTFIFKTIANSLSGGTGFGGLVGKFFLGLAGMAGGGSVAPATPYIVGERGPELFVPETAGKIVPSNRLAAGGVTINNIIDARGADGGVEHKVGRAFAVWERRVLARAHLQMQQAMLRNS